MDRRIFYGNILPTDISQALMAEFDRGNLHAQAIGLRDKIAVQIATRMGSMSGGQTAMTVTLQKVEDGVMIELGRQEWLGLAASLGHTAWAALRNPFSLLGRLDDLAQDIESIQLADKVWNAIDRAVAATGASRALSERLTRIACDYCGSASPLGEASCLSCGAPMGDAHPTACPHCGFALTPDETVCPNCNRRLA
ncbi:MAG TPA: zinc ribbon domain-containing protein [Anaerolineales bacterium]|nr:zinc ribbon domain-containing protein [Anaerolineales bacterium]